MYKVKIYLSILLCYCCLLCVAQGEDSTIEVKDIKLNEETNGYIELRLRLQKEGREYRDALVKHFEVSEKMGSADYFPRNIYDIQLLDSNEESKDTFAVLFVMDRSGSMRGEREETARRAISNTVKKMRLSPASKIYLASFDDDIFTSQIVGKSNIDNVLNTEEFKVPAKGKGKNTDLFRAIIEKVDEFKEHPIKEKVMILLTDGENDITGNPYYLNHKPFKEEDVYNRLSTLPKDFHLFSVGLGRDADFTFASKIVDVTPSKLDRFSLSKTSKDLENIFTNLMSGLSSNYKMILLPSNNEVFKGSERKLIVDWLETGKRDVKYYKVGSVTNPIRIIDFVFKKAWWYWLIWFIIGLVIIGGILGILKYMIPRLKRRNFKKNYVRPFKIEKAEKGLITQVKKRDPVTLEPFNEGDLVVYRCQQLVSYDTWKAIGDHCPNYPNCMDFNSPCDGAGKGEGHKTLEIFSKQGASQIYSWIWFGCFGGFIAWCLFALSKVTNMIWHEQLLSKILNTSVVENALLSFSKGEDILNNISILANDILVGIVLGVGLVFALSYIEEKRDAREFSWRRILVRTGLGLIVSSLIFLLGYLFQYLVLSNPYLSGLLIWLLFGLTTGLILSVNSSIEPTRGLKGGILAALVGFHAYFGIGWLLSDFSGASKLVSFIILGAILGGILVSVLVRLEDFELEYLSPSQYKGMIRPISKWLRRESEIFIGTSQKCYVYIKWGDEAVESKHAKLSYQNNIVYIEPLHETLVNGNLISFKEKTPLNDGDRIQLGRSSISIMKYVEKRSKGHLVKSKEKEKEDIVPLKV